MNKDIKIGDLVRSKMHIGIGIVIDIIYPEKVRGKMLLDAVMAEIYWVFPDPMPGSGWWQNGNDYDYLSQITVIKEEIETIDI